MTDRHYDVVIVGAGLLGCFSARNLARYQLRVAVLERENDLCMGISRANTAIVYSGIDTKPQTLKTELTVEGNRSFDKLCEDLCVPFRRCGSLMVAFGPRAEQVLQKKLEQGLQNGVEDLALLNAAEALKLEPQLSPAVTLALYSPSTGTVNPWELCIAAAQNAHANGVAFYFEHEVAGIEKLADSYRLTCANGVAFTARAVVNCAGLAADRVSEMVAPVSFRFKPTRGDYLILDEAAEGFVTHIVFHEPEMKSKGATFVPTIDGNIMIGPSEEPVGLGQEGGVGITSEIEGAPRSFSANDSAPESLRVTSCAEFILNESEGPYADYAPECFEGTTSSAKLQSTPSIPGITFASSPCHVSQSCFPTTTEGLAFNRRLAEQVFPGIPLDQTIRSFSTLRPNIYWATASDDGDIQVSDESISTFHIAEAPGCPGFINVAGIKTPGLTCADGIGRSVADMLLGFLDPVEENAQFVAQRFAPVRFSRLLKAATNSDSTHPESYEIVCRCNRVTVEEVRRAIREPLGARTIDGVKRRCGTCLGRCQGSFCTERIISLLSEELGLSPAEILKDRAGSTMLELSEMRQGDGTVLSPLGDKGDKGTVNLSSFPKKMTSLPSPCHSACHSSIRPAPSSSYHPDTGTSAPSSPCFASTSTLLLPDTTQSIPLVIIGGGGAGIAAALGAQKQGIAPHDILLVERHPYLGGLLPQCLHAGFGMRKHHRELNGPEYIAPLISELLQTGIQLKLNTSTIRIQPDRVLTLAGPGGMSRIQAEAVIIATGCRERPIGSLPIAGTRPSGIFTAGAAQKMVNVNGWDLGRRIVVLGSGDVGLIMAGRFAALGKEVVAVIEQEAQCGGLRRNKQRYLDPFNIPLLLNSRITHIHGNKRITAVEYEQKYTDGSRIGCSASGQTGNRTSSSTSSSTSSCTSGSTSGHTSNQTNGCMSNHTNSYISSHTSRRIDCDTLITSVGLIPEVDLLRELTESTIGKTEGRLVGNPIDGLPPWIFVAGNARRVQSFIEDVLHDGSIAGQAAALELTHSDYCL